ncbi:MAG TPA: glycosyl hydrolase family 28-related protein [Anaeromyxobacteraceae bacterium]|nr:glycosyl hydrolase family 28-related protein [Anaeromyxobacteraceae bacterium]
MPAPTSSRRFAALHALLLPALVAGAAACSSGASPAATSPAPSPSPASPGVATAVQASALLSVQIVGDAEGAVTATGAVLTCSALQGAAEPARLCWALVPLTTPPQGVRLTASPGAGGARFAGWGGSCSGSRPCDLTMTAAASVTALFVAAGDGGPAPTGVSDPVAFGARCDGATDDAPALRAAAEAATRTGDTLLVPCRLRLASGSIDVPVAVQVVGPGAFDLQPGSSLALRGALLAGPATVFHRNGGVLDVQVTNARILPQWWGARGDGAADDAPAIQAAIDAASRPPLDTFEWNQGVGGTVSLSRGIYRLRSGLVVRGDAVRLQGDGTHQTSLLADMDPTRDVITVGDGTGAGRNLSIADLTIYAKGPGKFRDGIVVDGATWSMLENVAVSYASGNAYRIRGTLHVQLHHLRANKSGTGLWIGATAAGVEATTVHVSQFATTASSGPGVVVEKAYGVLLDQLTSEWCGSMATPEASQGIVVGTPTTGATTEVTLLHPYFEGNAGWDVEIGLDPLYPASATIVGGSFRASWPKQPGYGAIRVERARGGAALGGYLNGYDAPAETIRLSQAGWNFTVLGLDMPGDNPPRVTGASLDQYRGRITTYDAAGDVWDRGRVISRAGGVGGGAGTAFASGGGPPSHCDPPWTTGSIVWNATPDRGQPIGWVCVAAGTPGNWLPLPRLE